MNTASNPLGVLMLDVKGLQLSSEDREILSRPVVGGVILGLHGRNFASIQQLQDLCAEIRQCNSSLLIAVDQEGGRVQRFQHEFTRLPPMYEFGKIFQIDPAEGLALAQTCGWLMAAEVLSCGLDFSFAPVMDLYLRTSRVIADRAFSANPQEVGQLAKAFINGMHSAGMKATGKHFPGHGSVEADSHTEVPVDQQNLDQLMAADLKPFVDCLSILDALMPGHVIYPKIDRNCASLSKVWLQDILRQKLGFTGVIFSDDLGMAAAGPAGNAQRRAEVALAAGCDMILVCNNRDDVLATAHWLELHAWPPSSKLALMQGRRELSREDLLLSDEWLHACAAIEAMNIYNG